MPTIAVVSPPVPADDAVVTAGLRADLAPAWGVAERTPVSLYLRDDDGCVVGGIVARIAWRWLYIDHFWVDAPHRRQGHGAALLAAAEAFAAAQGCHGAHLDTFGEAALPFYLRHGYEVWGTLEDLPPGGRQHALRKPFALR